MGFLEILVKIKRKLFYFLNLASAKIVLSIHGIVVGRNIMLTSIPYIFRYKGSKIILHNDVRMHGNLYNNSVCGSHKMVLTTLSATAIIEIGEGSAISCATIAAYKRVTIGKRVYVGAGVKILDTDFHPVDPVKRKEDNQLRLADSRPIEICDDAWLGMESIVLKGVTIGRGAVVAARAVVTKDVPPNVMVAGVPAREIRKLVP